MSGSGEERPDRVKVLFRLSRDEDGWPPVGVEGVWAIPRGGDVVEIDNVPWFALDVASGDLVRTESDEHGAVWAVEKLSWSGNCTIRVIPLRDRSIVGRQAVLDAFSPLGVDGEGLQQFDMVALNVPSDVDVLAVKRVLQQGRRDGLWDYEEGCVGDAWVGVEPD